MAGLVVRGYPTLVACGGAARLRPDAQERPASIPGPDAGSTGGPGPGKGPGPQSPKKGSGPGRDPDPGKGPGKNPGPGKTVGATGSAPGSRTGQAPLGADLTILPDAGSQKREHGAGVTALALARTVLPPGRVSSRWSGDEALVLAASPYRSTPELVADLQLAAARSVASRWADQAGRPLAQVREQAVFEDLVAWVRQHLEDEVYRLAVMVVRTLQAVRRVEQAVGEHTSLTLLATLQEVREHVAELVYPGFVVSTPTEELAHLPRFLSALAVRVERAASSPGAAAQDAALSYQVGQAVDLVEAARARASALPPDAHRQEVLEEARWMVEELRVSLFAQTLGTSRKVSLQRISRLLASI